MKYLVKNYLEEELNKDLSYVNYLYHFYSYRYCEKATSRTNLIE